MTEDDINLSDTPTPEPPADAYGRIKGAKTETGADMYAGLTNAHMSFDGIGCLEAVNGNIVIRGRNGMRDHIITLERAIVRYFNWMDLITQYARLGVAGWTEGFDIAKDFKAKICEAVQQRKEMQLDIPPEAQKFVDAANGVQTTIQA